MKACIGAVALAVAGVLGVLAAQTPPPANRSSPATEGVGLVRNDPGAYQGYTLLSPLQSRTTFLIDMNGSVVNSWETDSTPSSLAYLLENGNLLRAGAQANSPFGGGVAGGGGRIQEFTWDGALVWDFTYSSETRLPHHDFARLPNGNVLMIVADRISRDAAIAAGRIPSSIPDNGVYADSLVEIRPTGETTGEVVWEWRVWDHLVQDHDAAQANYGDVRTSPGRVDVNFTVVPDRRAADWTHFNAVAYNAALDQVIVSLRNFSEIWVIDHSTTTMEAAGRTGGRSGKGGDLLYRWGNPPAYRAGTADDQRLFGQHDVHWIPEGLPGAGRLLLFNNGDGRPDGMYSSVEEIVPPMDATGRYILGPDGKYGPERAAWSYTAPNETDFYSFNISGAMRLPNGNTLICSGAPGFVFEVTPEGRVVWQYNLPSFAAPGGGRGGPGPAGPGGRAGAGGPTGADGAARGRGDADGAAAAGGAAPGRGAAAARGGGRGRGGAGGGNAGRNVFRAYRYGPDYPGLAGRQLTGGRALVELVQ